MILGSYNIVIFTYTILHYLWRYLITYQFFKGDSKHIQYCLINEALLNKNVFIHVNYQALKK